MTNFDSKLFDNVFVSIIILNYNGGQHLLECIESLFHTINCKKEIILIDNNSIDNSHIKCKENFSDIVLIQNDNNIGMAARNIGIERAHGNFIIFLDSDTIATTGWLCSLISCYKKNGEGLYQPKLLERDNIDVINSAGNMTNVFGLAYSRGKGEKDVGQFNKFCKISYASGACTFSTAETMRKIGGIDSIFFAYHDDVDFGWRASMMGIPSYYEPESVVYHKGSPTLKWSKKKFFLLERNRWICLLTLYSRNTLIKILPLLLLVEIGILFFFLGKGMIMTKLESYYELIKIRRKLAERREKILAIRKVGDDVVVRNFVDDFFLPTITLNSRASSLFNYIIGKLAKISRQTIGSR